MIQCIARKTLILRPDFAATQDGKELGRRFHLNGWLVVVSLLPFASICN